MQIYFDVPDSFHEITPAEHGQTGREAVSARLGERVGEFTRPDLDELADAFEAMSRLFDRAGVFYAANSFAEIRGALSVAMLTMSATPLSFTDPQIAATGIARSLEARWSGAAHHAQRLDLPCGAAALSIGRSEGLRIPAVYAHGGEDVPVETAQLQAYVPVPPPDRETWGSQLVTVTCATPSFHHWDDYCEIMADLLRSIAFRH